MRSLVRFQLAPHVDFPPGFFDRADPGSDAAFYRPLRLVTHIDDGAIAAVGALYDELGNDDELAANPQAAARVVHDLNADPTLPFPDDSFDAAVCCVSIDYLVRPVEV